VDKVVFGLVFVEVKFVTDTVALSMKYTYLMALSVCRSQLQVWDKWGGEL
jgi:hypothetical protein